MKVVAPGSPAELVEIVRDAAASRAKLDIRGGGSKKDIGGPIEEATVLDMRGFAGIVDYDPAELVLTVGAGTLLEEIETLVVEQKQMLAFDPVDYAPLMGRERGKTTIGGVVAGAVAGPRRLSRGGVRDHLLGFSAVSGRGEPFVAGGKVVKNVTGYDLPKLMAGSWGRLAALTEVTLKVLPAPRRVETYIVQGLDAEQAYRAMSIALGSQAEVAAAVHLPEGSDGSGTGALTAFRLEGFAASVAARAALLEKVVDPFGRVELAEAPRLLWEQVETLAPFANDPILWRVSIPPKAMPRLAGDLMSTDARWLADWGGGLVWTEFAGDPERLRGAAASYGGHAMLVRGASDLRAAVPTFHPQPPALAELEARVRRGFDPAGVFETGRF